MTTRTEQATPPSAEPDPVEGEVWETVGRLARCFDAHDDARGLDQAQQWTLQVLRIAEETGEASQAVIGARGTNPDAPAASMWVLSIPTRPPCSGPDLGSQRGGAADSRRRHRGRDSAQLLRRTTA